MSTKRKNKLIRIIAIVSILVVVVLLGFTGDKLIHRFTREETAVSTESGDKLRPVLDSSVMTVDGVDYVKNSRVESFLIIGVDRTDEQIERGTAAGQSDVLLLAVLNSEDDTFSIVDINRDTVTQVIVLNDDGDISGEIFAPICLSHSYGTGGKDSCENVVNSVEYLLTGAQVDGYLALDLSSIAMLNDAVGGVTVTIDKDMTAADPSFVKGATVTLDENTAEAFVRARLNVGEDTNENRQERQMQFMNAWLDKARTLGENDMLKLLDDMGGLMVTDLSEKRIVSIAEKAQRFENQGIIKPEGEYSETSASTEFHVDPDSISRLVLELFYKEA